MSGFQSAFFNWVAVQPALTGLVVLALGLMYSFQGYRFFRALLVLSAGCLGWCVGWLLGEFAGSPAGVMGLVGAAASAGGALKWNRPAAIVVCGATCGVGGFYLAMQLGFKALVASGAGALTGGLGLLFAWLCFRTMVVVLTTAQGAALLVLGFVGVTSSIMPSVGATFRAWAASQSLLVPILMAMLFVMGYSYQAMHQQGDICTGVST
ncbi:MAG: hypothetical protein KKB50_01670 [Planctomycetes bacterium]|nr:hypothetical protein [Planctomycetota bacterium]